MPWQNEFLGWFKIPQKVENFLKAFICFILKHYLRKYLSANLQSHQLQVNVRKQSATVSDLYFDEEELNKDAEKYQIPCEVVKGYVEEIKVSIPLKSLFQDSIFVQIRGLNLILKPKVRQDPTSMFESMINKSMTASVVHDFREYLQKAENAPPLDGIEVCTQAIESILKKIQVQFVDTCVTLKHENPGAPNGIALEMRIKNLEYTDEAGSDPTGPVEKTEPSKETTPAAFTTKHLYLEGVTFYTAEYLCTNKSNPENASKESTPDSKNSDTQFSPAQTSSTQNISQPVEKSTYNLDESNWIMFAKLSGRQQVRLKEKAGEGIMGPNVEVMINFGSLTVFLTPRQTQLLIELLQRCVLATVKEINTVTPKIINQKKMAYTDFNKVENILVEDIRQTHGYKTMVLRNTQGWSTASPDDSDNNEDDFLPMISTDGALMTTSITSSNISMDESIGSSASSKNSITNAPRRQKFRHSVDSDPSVDMTVSNVQICSVAVVLLHEDILSTEYNRSSIEMMKAIADKFFQKIGTFAVNGYGNNDFDRASKVFTEVCPYSHLRLLAAPLIVEITNKRTSQCSSISGTLSLASFEVIECLVDNETSADTISIELLSFFKENTTNANMTTSKPDLEMKFSHTEKISKRPHITKYSHPRTKFEITLQPCQGEFDITIINRISALLNLQPICKSSPYTTPNDNTKSVFYQAVESPSLPESRTDIKINALKCIINLRFPIPDLRPMHDENRLPGWRRNIRPDYITLHLTDAKLHTSFESHVPHLARHEIQCRHFLLTYTEADSDLPLEIGKASVDERSDESLSNVGEGFGWPRVVITIFPQHVGGPLEDSSDGEPDSSLDDTLENTPRQAPSPFSARKVIHESKVPHSRSQNSDGAQTREGEELIIPGSRQEMTEFIEIGSHNTKIQLEINLPCASVQIPSKHLYELIYNRFNNDLLLWQPSAPRRMMQPELNIGFDIPSALLQESYHHKFSMCKSAIQYDSDSDTDDESTFMSATDRKLFKKPNRTQKNGQSKVALTLTINQGLVTMYTPVRDTKRNVIPGQKGEIILKIEDATLFSVSNFKSDENLGYVCVMVKDIALYHCGLVSMPSQSPPLRSINSILPRHCEQTIYRTEPGANISTNSVEKDMVSVAIKIQANHETHRIKTFRVSVGINQATLMHRVTAPHKSWYTQFTDCLDVTDHPVLGYVPPGVLTELHVHLWDCAIDYRPIYLPLRSMITIGNFSVSSNIAAQTNTSTLRFIVEDLALFISDKTSVALDLKRYYVCVLNIDLFELSLRLNEKMCGNAPRVDLRASNHEFHLRTCVDSAKALMDLLTYFASDGDMASSTVSTENISVPSSEDGESLLGDESINLLSKSQVQRVNILMEEAMEDTFKDTIETTEPKSQGNRNCVEVFYFPDESAQAMAAEMRVNCEEAIEAISSDGDQVINVDDDDDGFCILGEEAGTGIPPVSGIPTIRWFDSESFMIVDNHFSTPSGKTDALKAPKNFPGAVLRYTLCEMTLYWHIYGGKDFGMAPSPKKTTMNDYSAYYGCHGQERSRSATEGIRYNKSSPHRVHFGSVPNSPRPRIREVAADWIDRGGPGREQDVLMEFQLNKVRFQREIYPENTVEASRHVFIVNEFEIRDRLAKSHINKFLYLYSSQDRPRQSQANMFTLKIFDERPDPKLSAQETSIKIGLLPVRLNIDQDSLLFLITFFTDLASHGVATNPDHSIWSKNAPSTPGSKQGTPTHQPPVMSVNEGPDEVHSVDVTENANSNRNLLILTDDELNNVKENRTNAKIINETQEYSHPVYFKSVVFNPEVIVRIDYHGKHVDLSRGPVAGLLMGLAQLNNSEIRLKSINYRQGILGVDKLISFLLAEWMQDIKKHHIPSLLSGVGPMYSFVQLVQGIRDLFWLPIEQYQRDGRIVRGLQRGVHSFKISTATALLELTSRLIYAIQSTAETAYDMVSPGPSVRCRPKGRRGRKKRQPPLDIREGMSNAIILVKEGLGEAATQLLRVASEEHEQKGVSGAVGGVLRQIPPSVVKPIILATEATGNVLGGMRSQLVPDARREAVQKWRVDFNDVD